MLTQYPFYCGSVCVALSLCEFLEQRASPSQSGGIFATGLTGGQAGFLPVVYTCSADRRAEIL